MPTPIGLIIAKKAVARGLFSGLNQKEATFAGAFKIKGYPIPPMMAPAITQ
jgi:hypothetical protein